MDGFIWGNYNRFLTQEDEFFGGLKQRCSGYVEVEYTRKNSGKYI